jgi:DcuC family C4-dicarboxylate transporter
MLLAAGGLVTLAMIYLLIKQHETRLVLFGAGMLLALLARQPMAPFQAFSHAMQENKLFESIIAVMGFAMVMKLTQCDQHLIHALVRPLRKAGPVLIPAATLVTFFINTSITSSAGCAAAVGSILIPVLLAAGIHPAIAAACIYAGTYGAIFNPGYAQVALVAEVSKNANMAVVANHFSAMVVSGLIVAGSLFVVAYLLKENRGYQTAPDQATRDEHFRIHPIKALVPLIPLTLLILGSTRMVPAFKDLAISHAMIIGAFCGFLATRVSPERISKEFWRGAGDAFGHVFGIIICALVFVEGLKAAGVIRAMTDLMLTSPHIVKITSAFGPFVIGVLSGSGDAAAVAFNRAVTPGAAGFGISAMNMGSAAAIGGALGRSMSPIAGGMIISCAFAGCSPMEAAKRNAPGMVLACIAVMGMLLFR